LIITKLGLSQKDLTLFSEQASRGSKATAVFGAFLATTGIALIPYHPSLLSITLVISGLLALGVAGVWMIRNILIYLRMVMSDMDRLARVMARVYSQYRSRIGRLDEVDGICAIGRREVSPEHVSAENLRKRVTANTEILQIVEKVEDGKVSLAGYSVLMPLKPTTTNRILNSEVFAGFQLGPDDIAKTFKNASSLYISIIYGRPEGWSRAAMLIDLRERISSVVRTSKNPPVVFARPGEVRGRYWMDKLGFTPIDSSEIWKLAPAKVAEFFR
jgi:hypothetical protein